MAFIAVTYTFINGNTSSATEVNQNFTDIINGTSDGTKDLTVAAITCTSINITNDIDLGSSSVDDVTFNGSLASSIPIKVTRTYDIGSADLGLKILYLGGNSTHTVALQAPSSGMAGDVSLSLPPAAGVVGHGLQYSSTTALATAPMQTDINAVASADYTVLDTDGYGVILMTTGASDRTVTLPTAADNTDRKLVIKKVDSAAGIVIVDGESSETIDGATTYTLDGQYSFITIVCDGSNWQIVNRYAGLNNVFANTGSGRSTNVRLFGNTIVTGTAITHSSGVFTVNRAGVYAMQFIDRNDTNIIDFCITKNQATIGSVDENSVIAFGTVDATAWGTLAATLTLAAGDAIRCLVDNTGTNSGSGRVSFRITKIF